MEREADGERCAICNETFAAETFKVTGGCKKPPAPHSMIALNLADDLRSSLKAMRQQEGIDNYISVANIADAMEALRREASVTFFSM